MINIIYSIINVVNNNSHILDNSLRTKRQAYDSQWIPGESYRRKQGISGRKFILAIDVLKLQ